MSFLSESFIFASSPVYCLIDVLEGSCLALRSHCCEAGAKGFVYCWFVTSDLCRGLFIFPLCVIGKLCSWIVFLPRHFLYYFPTTF